MPCTPTLQAWWGWRGGPDPLPTHAGHANWRQCEGEGCPQPAPNPCRSRQLEAMRRRGMPDPLQTHAGHANWRQCKGEGCPNPIQTHAAQVPPTVGNIQESLLACVEKVHISGAAGDSMFGPLEIPLRSCWCIRQLAEVQPACEQQAGGAVVPQRLRPCMVLACSGHLPPLASFCHRPLISTQAASAPPIAWTLARRGVWCSPATQTFLATFRWDLARWHSAGMLMHCKAQTLECASYCSPPCKTILAVTSDKGWGEWAVLHAAAALQGRGPDK